MILIKQLMPPCHPMLLPNSEIKQLYIDGHFCYAYKIGIVTNGLGIIRHLVFYNKDFFQKHPEIIIEKKSDSPKVKSSDKATNFQATFKTFRNHLVYLILFCSKPILPIYHIVCHFLDGYISYLATIS